MADGQLTERQLQVLRAYAAGHDSYRSIAGAVGIAVGTAYYHMTAAIDHLRAHSRAHAVVIALSRGLIEAPPASREDDDR